MRRYWPCLLLSAGIFLSACASSDCCSSAMDASVNRSASCQQKHRQQELAQRLRGENVQVVQVGEETTLVLQTNDFFNSDSNNMSGGTGVLDDVVDFSNAYKTENIEVTGYPDKRGSAMRNLALSRAQAQEIAHYLQDHGLNTRLISADVKRTVSEVPRIEIFFRLPAPVNVFH